MIVSEKNIHQRPKRQEGDYLHMYRLPYGLQHWDITILQVKLKGLTSKLNNRNQVRQLTYAK